MSAVKRSQIIWHEYGHVLAFAGGGKRTCKFAFPFEVEQLTRAAVEGRFGWEEVNSAITARKAAYESEMSPALRSALSRWGIEAASAAGAAAAAAGSEAGAAAAAGAGK